MAIGESLVTCICNGPLSRPGDSITNVSAVVPTFEKLHTGNRGGISISVIYIFVALIICRVTVQSTGYLLKCNERK